MISVEGLKVEFNATALFEDVSYVMVSVNALRDASIRMIQILQLIKLLPQI